MKKLAYFFAVTCLLSLVGIQSFAQSGVQKNLTLRCSQDNFNARPYVLFDFYVASNQAKIDATVYPFSTSEIAAIPQTIPGCERANVKWGRSGKSFYFECAGDGDAGYGRVWVGPKSIAGTFTFPVSGIPPYQDGATIKFSCPQSKISK